LANSGFYVLSPEVLDFIERAKYLHMTDLIKMAIEQGHKVVVYSISPYSWFDFGTKEKFFRNRIKFLKMNGKRDY
jgi:NDP-sugar pyrophosphorylase family protein